MRWFPWRYIVRRMATGRGFIDPISLLAKAHQFAQPSEVDEPVELLRAGVVFHARGFINTKAIQHNLDWVWPYWVERQFDPSDDAFIPRAFSITHVNLTHRNWTAVGLPGSDLYSIVDPAGLVMPFWDSWSIDAWLIDDDDRELMPSRDKACRQSLLFDNGLVVDTRHQNEWGELATQTEMMSSGGGPVCVTRIEARSDSPAWLVVSVRPYNPEGVSFIEAIKTLEAPGGFLVNGEQEIRLSEPPEEYRLSDYRVGDVYSSFHHEEIRSSMLRSEIECGVEMATGGAFYRLSPGKPRSVQAAVAMSSDRSRPMVNGAEFESAQSSWEAAVSGCCELECSAGSRQFLYDAAVRTLILHSPQDVFPGPYTYKRFWFRDTAFIGYALLCAGLHDSVRNAIEFFLPRQLHDGYFRSQEGEWDSNGQVLWLLERYCELSGSAPPPEWEKAVTAGARWIGRKRLSSESVLPHAGLLPAGFSAEHLGLNDYYYWDDFWAVAGLCSAASLLERLGRTEAAAGFRQEAQHFLADIHRSIDSANARNRRVALPASPYRRLDAGAVGSLCAGYPLRLLAPDDPQLFGTVEFLLKHCCVHDGFFQDMIHSGINAYLTLHLAQVLLRAGDPRYRKLVAAVADLASDTGQWPEAIHPRTKGGCMGDGQHAWAAADWLMMVRNSFVREEDDRLILLSGLDDSWFDGSSRAAFGPAPTRFGSVHVSVDRRAGTAAVTVEGEWRGEAPELEIRLPGFEPHCGGGKEQSVEIEVSAAP